MNYKEHKDMLKLFSKYNKASLVNVLNKEASTKVYSHIHVVVSYLYKLETDNVYSYCE